MRRLGAVLLVVAMGIVIATPVGAAKPDCDDRPSHPSCQDDEPLAGTTCAALGRWLGEPVTGDSDIGTEDFNVPLSGKSDSACIDVMAIEGSWTVHIDIGRGTVRSLLLVPRDSIAPGDSCGGFSFRRDIPETVVLPGPAHPSDIDDDGMIEGAYVNSCGVEFGEWVGDKNYSEVKEDIESPLAFQVSMTGSSDAEVTLRVYLPVPESLQE